MAGKNKAPRKQKKKPVDLRDLAVGESTESHQAKVEAEVEPEEPKQRDEPKRTKTPGELNLPNSPAFVVPGVYRESGYFVLALSVDPHDAREVFMLHTYVEEEKRYPRFGNELQFGDERKPLPYTALPNVDPYELALSLLARTVTGLFAVPAAVERRLFAMLTKDALMAMSERRLGAAYRDVMGKGPARIPANENREPLVDQLLAKLRENTNAKLDAEGKVIVPTKKPRSKKEAKEKKPKEKKEKKPKAPKEPGERKPRTPRDRKFVAVSSNPFREPSKKWYAFKLFLKFEGKEREQCLEQIQALGVTPSTATSWYGSFWKLCEAKEK